jgi:putative tryptophan/tyrosine transport system substrate-binding protein
LAADLVERKVDLIAAFGGIASARAAKDATSTIPIVFLIGTDPVADGLVVSFTRPGGNRTGVSLLIGELYPKGLELLTELVPQARVIALLINPSGMNAEGVTRVVQERRPRRAYSSMSGRLTPKPRSTWRSGPSSNGTPTRSS